MIDFELSEAAQNLKTMVHGAAEAFMRPVSRQFDEDEHSIPWDFINFMWQTTQGSDANLAGKKPAKDAVPASERNLQLAVSIEELSWGDAGLYLSTPGPGLGGAAVAATGTPEQ
jgi:acyl-CoA dehydrogenase